MIEVLWLVTGLITGAWLVGIGTIGVFVGLAVFVCAATEPDEVLARHNPLRTRLRFVCGGVFYFAGGLVSFAAGYRILMLV